MVRRLKGVLFAVVVLALGTGVYAVATRPTKTCRWKGPIDRADARACASIPDDAQGFANERCLERLGYELECHLERP